MTVLRSGVRAVEPSLKALVRLGLSTEAPVASQASPVSTVGLAVAASETESRCTGRPAQAARCSGGHGSQVGTPRLVVRGNGRILNSPPCRPLGCTSAATKEPSASISAPRPGGTASGSCNTLTATPRVSAGSQVLYCHTAKTP